MKKFLQNASTGSDKNIGRFLSLFLFFFMSINLSGQNIQSMLNETWESGNWVKAIQTSYTYDVNGYKLTSLSQVWDVPTLSWEDQARSSYSNNPDGTANIVTNQIWDGSTWNDASRTTYTYNASKQVLTSITETWLGMWMNGTKHTNTYTGGYLTNSLSQTWDIIGSNWKNLIQSNYTNNPSGYPTETITQTWDGISSWNNTTQTISTYNGANKILTEVINKWVSPNWVADLRETFNYDGSGYLINAKTQLWNTGSSTYIDDTQSNYTNNTSGAILVIIDQDWIGSAWVNIDRITYTYSGPTAISETINEADYSIYPNPANNVITIRSKNSKTGSSYSITDQTGKLVLQGKLQDETTPVDITTLNNGIYFIKIGDRSQPTFKVIKQGLK
jgi:hypothetical protein